MSRRADASSYKPTETFQYTNFHSCHPPGVTKGFIKGEALRLLGANSSKTTPETSIKDFVSHLLSKGYPVSLVKSFLEKFNSVTETLLLRNKIKPHEKIISPLVTQHCQALHSVKHTLREK